MAVARSRRNGLRVFIPTDARGVLYRFAVSGGGNELIFDPIKRRDFDHSAKIDSAPAQLGAPDRQPVQAPDTSGEDLVSGTVALGTNIADDDGESGQDVGEPISSSFVDEDDAAAIAEEEAAAAAIIAEEEAAKAKAAATKPAAKKTTTAKKTTARTGRSAAAKTAAASAEPAATDETDPELF